MTTSKMRGASSHRHPSAVRGDAASTADDVESQLKAHDVESKRARGAISCAECRRLKLKCDKTVPCGSCRRRGCESICPNGKLVTGHGTRFVLADTDRLHKKITEMSERIRQLEDGLSILQSSFSREPHPLLNPDMLKIKSNIDLHSATDEERNSRSPEAQHPEGGVEVDYVDSFGTLAVHEGGGSTFYGRSAGTESLLIGEEISGSPSLPKPSRADTASAPPQAHSEYTRLGSTLPFGPLGQQRHTTWEEMANACLPPWNRARALADIYCEYESWFFQAVTQRQLEEELLPMFYAEAEADERGRQLRGFTGLRAKKPTPGAHDLALLFAVLAMGSLFDISNPAPPEPNPEMDTFYLMSKAALNLQPLMENASSLSTIQTLSTLGIFQALTVDENSIEGMWAHFGMASKLSQSIGLHRDPARWGVSNFEVMKRRSLFWELCTTDNWVSLATGRIQTFPLEFVDCELSLDPEQTLDNDGTTRPSLPAWKARFGAQALSGVAGALTAKVPKYSTILELDRKIRDLVLPVYAMEEAPKGKSLHETMWHFMPRNYVQYAMMYLHRSFFARALVDHPNDPLRSPHAPSFLAGYNSACTTLSLLRDAFDIFPREIARVWLMWTHGFSATVMIASVVTHGARSKIAPMALLELNKACDLFTRAATHGGRAVKFLGLVQKLYHKAYQTMVDARNGSPSIPGHLSVRPSNGASDHLQIFSGKINKIDSKPAQSSSPSSVASASATPPQGQIPGQGQFALEPPPTSLRYTYWGMHPALANQLHGFDHQLNNPHSQPSQPAAHALHTLPLEEQSQTRQGILHTPPEGYYLPQMDRRPSLASTSHSSATSSPAERYAPPPDLPPMLLPQQHTQHHHHPASHQQHPQNPIHFHSQHMPPPTPTEYSSRQMPMMRDDGRGGMYLPPHSQMGNAGMMHPGMHQGAYDEHGQLISMGQTYPPAAEEAIQADPGMQETWTSYMQQMDLPRGPVQFVFQAPGAGPGSG